MEILEGFNFTLRLKPQFELVFTWCPSGKYTMYFGQSINRVELTKGYWISTTAITQIQWLTIMSQTNVRDFSFIQPELYQVPMDRLHWSEGLHFCEELTSKARSELVIDDLHCFDLPTEAEWEYACRAGTTTQWFFGDNPDDLEHYAWYGRFNDKFPHPVAQKLPSPWGLYDVYGNISEWCLDDSYVFQEGSDYNRDPLYISPKEVTQKIARGGDYSSSAKFCTSSYRFNGDYPDNPLREPIGIRPVLINSSDPRINRLESPASRWITPRVDI